MHSEQKYRLRTDMLKFKEAVAWTENERKRHMLHKNICPFTVDPAPPPEPTLNSKLQKIFFNYCDRARQLQRGIPSSLVLTELQ